MKFRSLLAGLFFTLLAGCGSNGLATMKPEVDVEIVNLSSRNLTNALARFGAHTCEWGNVGKTFTAGFGFYPHPITTKTELNWDEEGKSRAERLDLSKVYPAGKSGRLTFTVYDDRVDVSFREKS